MDRRWRKGCVEEGTATSRETEAREHLKGEVEGGPLGRESDRGRLRTSGWAGARGVRPARHVTWAAPNKLLAAVVITTCKI
jgi:hypothetical protein